MFHNDWIYSIFCVLSLILLGFSMLYTFNLAGENKTFEDGFKALVMMGTSMTLIVVIEWLRYATSY